MGDGRFLCKGVSWHRHGPVLSLASPEGVHPDLDLPPGDQLTGSGTDLGFRVLSQYGERHCLGFHRVFGPESREHTPCPKQAMPKPPNWKSARCWRGVVIGSGVL